MNRINIKTANLRNAAGVAVQTRWRYLLPTVSKEQIETEFGVGPDFSIPYGSLLNGRTNGRSLRLTKEDQKEKDRMKKKHDTRFPRKIRSLLYVMMTRDLGIAKREASKLSNLSQSDFRRVEDMIAAMVDCLWACDPSIFLDGSADYGVVVRTARAIFKTGAYTRIHLVSAWKEWTNWLKHTVARTKLIGAERPPLGYGNLFRNLNRLTIVVELLQTDPEKLTSAQLAQLGHLTSTRQCPYTGRRRESLALKEFKDVITSTPPEIGLISTEVEEAIRDVAKRCKRARGSIPIPEKTAHASLTCSGERTSSCRNGGQAVAVLTSIKEFLAKPLSDKDFDEETPFGLVHHRGGIPLWKYLFRDGYKFDFEFYRNLDFMDEWMAGGINIEVEGYYYGLDGVLGRQLLYVAWKQAVSYGYPQKPPTIRCSTVAEMGDKARIVTVSDWWLNFLQAPVGHWLVELLRFHPSSFSAFCRQDQAWSFQSMASKLDPLWAYEKRYNVLSSDLKNATNAIPLRLMRWMWQVFLSEFKVNLSDRPYLNFVIGLISDRLVEFPKIELYERGKRIDHLSMKPEVVRATRGLPMGEALAKPSLTLWALVAEQLGYNRTLRLARRERQLFKDSRMVTRFTDGHLHSYVIGDDGELHQVRMRKPEDRAHVYHTFGRGFDQELLIASEHRKSWRCFHLGGDDHVAMGPVSYLDSITAAFRDLGAMLSPAKHGYSHSFIQYCERIVDIRRTNRPRVVDTMKIRLLETGASTGITRDQRNVAIGKAAQFRKYIEWAQPLDGWSPWKKFQLQCLWISRMGKFLPKIGTPEFFGIFLPPELGGFGLGLDYQVRTCIQYVVPAQREAALYVLTNTDNFDINSQIISRMRKMVTNPTARGVAKVAQLEEEIKTSVNMMPKFYNARSWRELREDPNLQFMKKGPDGKEVPETDNRRIAKLLAQRGIVPAAEYAKRYSRGSLFTEMLMHPESIKPFNTAHYVTSLKQFTSWWTSFKKKHNIDLNFEGLVIDENSSINSILGKQQPNWFVDCNEQIEICVAARVRVEDDWGALEGGGYEPLDWDNVPYITGPRIVDQYESGKPDINIGLAFAGLDFEA